MNFQQLRIIRETIGRDFNLSEVAVALSTSQPGVSRNIKDLEGELGLQIFVRRGKRLMGLTPAGRELAEIVDKILVHSQNMKRLADQFASRNQGNLVIATTHTQARYALPEVVKSFSESFPRVHLSLHEGGPREIASMLANGDVDLAIATEGLEESPDIATYPCYTWHHVVIVPDAHPLCNIPKPTLEDLAQYPIVTYQTAITGRSHIDAAFQAAGLSPDIVLSAIDADVIKAYVEIGLGIGIIAPMAFHPGRDQGLRLLDTSHLFGENVTKIGIRRGHFLPDFAYRFIEIFAPGLSEDVVRPACHQG